MTRIVDLIVKYAFLLGSVAALALILSADTENVTTNAVLINLGTDFFVLGLTISFINQLLIKHDRQKFGNLPLKGLDAVTDEVKSLIAACAFELGNCVTVDVEDLIYSHGARLRLIPLMTDQMFEFDLLKLKHVDIGKVNYKNFAEVLRFARQSHITLNDKIGRYIGVFDSELVSKVYAIRDAVEDIPSDGILLLTIPFKGQHEPNALLAERDRSRFGRILEKIIKVGESQSKTGKRRRTPPALVGGVRHF
jgi:hypothetical protein